MGFFENLAYPQNTKLIEYNFAPTILRRDIGILGFTHKRILEKCYPLLLKLMPRREIFEYDYHSKQIDFDMNNIFHFQSLFHRSLFGKVFVYNRLTQTLVDEPTISNFQSRFTLIAKTRCIAGDTNWSYCFHDIDIFASHRLREQS